MLTFAHLWVFALLPLAYIIRRWAPPRDKPHPAVFVPFLVRAKNAGAVSRSVSSEDGLPLILRWVIWALVLTALARPQWLEPPIERTIPTRDLLLLVDLSASMDTKDFKNAQGAPISRLDEVKEVVGEFVSKRKGDRVGLVVFGNAPFLQIPFSTDLGLCRELLDQTAVGMAGPRTAFGDAIGLGIKLFEDSDAPAKTMIALTDGNDTDSSVPPAEAAQVAANRKIVIHTVAMGDPTKVGEQKLDQETLKDVAQEAGGEYFLALNRKELEGIYEQLDKIETRKIQTVSHRPRRDLFYWPLAVALILWMMALTWKTFGARLHAPVSTEGARLRVNPRTFELETSPK
ncbi:MAG: VWA domain-containing protein [Candidatus Omnitrophica bacterium]|nr:VWA domain-containing protein [Candidatus Omnitrophota bacterium]